MNKGFFIICKVILVLSLVACSESPKPKSFSKKFLKNLNDGYSQKLSVTIPNTIQEIKPFLHRGKNLHEVVFAPKSTISKIGKNAFEENNITDVVIPDSVVVIEDNAFKRNAITRLTLGTGLKNIGIDAFAENDVTLEVRVRVPLWEVFGSSSLGTTTSNSTHVNAVSPQKLVSIFSKAVTLKFSVDPKATLTNPERKDLEVFIKAANEAVQKMKDVHKITFDSMGSSTVAPLFFITQQDVNEGLALRTPTKLGYKFACWYLKDPSRATASQCKPEPSSQRFPDVDKDITLYAKWKVDTTQPTISNLVIGDVPTNKTYGTNALIELRATFSERVSVRKGDKGEVPYVVLNIGGVTQRANYAQVKNGGTTLVFVYKVRAGDNAEKGIYIGKDALKGNGAAIADAAGNEAVLSHGAVANASNYKVDTRQPTITGLAITSSPSKPNIYVKGDPVEVSVSFSERVSVRKGDKGEVPYVVLDIGGVTQRANYAQVKNGGTTLVFVYKVRAGDNDDNGINIGKDALKGNGAVIADAAGNEAVLTHGAVANASNYKVDTRQPTVTNLVMTSIPSKPNIYVKGDRIEVSVNFSERVSVKKTDKGKVPYVRLNIGGVTQRANYTQVKNGGTTLVFVYKVRAGDNAEKGIYIGKDALKGNGAAIADAAGNEAIITHVRVADNRQHTVDTLSMFVSVKIISKPKDNNSYEIGEFIEISVTFPRNVKHLVSYPYNPHIKISIGKAAKKAFWGGLRDTWTTSKTHIFKYQVQPDDEDFNGISIEKNMLSKPYKIRENDKNLSPITQRIAYIPIPDNIKHKVNAP